MITLQQRKNHPSFGYNLLFSANLRAGDFIHADLENQFFEEYDSIRDNGIQGEDYIFDVDLNKVTPLGTRYDEEGYYSSPQVDFVNNVFAGQNWDHGRSITCKPLPSKKQGVIVRGALYNQDPEINDFYRRKGVENLHNLFELTFSTFDGGLAFACQWMNNPDLHVYGKKTISY